MKPLKAGEAKVGMEVWAKNPVYCRFDNATITQIYKTTELDGGRMTQSINVDFGRYSHQFFLDSAARRNTEVYSLEN